MHHPFIQVLTTAQTTHGGQFLHIEFNVSCALRQAIPGGTVTKPRRCHRSARGRRTCSNRGSCCMRGEMADNRQACRLPRLRPETSAKCSFTNSPPRSRPQVSSCRYASCKESAMQHNCHSCQGWSGGASSCHNANSILFACTRKPGKALRATRAQTATLRACTRGNVAGKPKREWRQGKQLFHSHFTGP